MDRCSAATNGMILDNKAMPQEAPCGLGTPLFGGGNASDSDLCLMMKCTFLDGTPVFDIDCGCKQGTNSVHKCHDFDDNRNDPVAIDEVSLALKKTACILLKAANSEAGSPVDCMISDADTGVCLSTSKDGSPCLRTTNWIYGCKRAHNSTDRADPAKCPKIPANAKMSIAGSVVVMMTQIQL